MLTVETKFYRATFDNKHLEDITWAFLSAGVSCDTGRDETWALDADLTPEGWAYLDPYLDWIAPVVTVRWPDGTKREGQLGLYLVIDSPETHGETYGSVSLDARDPLYLLGVQAFDTKFWVSGNRTRLQAVRQILDGAVLTE